MERGWPFHPWACNTARSGSLLARSCNCSRVAASKQQKAGLVVHRRSTAVVATAVRRSVSRRSRCWARMASPRCRKRAGRAPAGPGHDGTAGGLLQRRPGRERRLAEPPDHRHAPCCPTRRAGQSGQAEADRRQPGHWRRATGRTARQGTSGTPSAAGPAPPSLDALPAAFPPGSPPSPGSSGPLAPPPSVPPAPLPLPPLAPALFGRSGCGLIASLVHANAQAKSKPNDRKREDTRATVGHRSNFLATLH